MSATLVYAIHGFLGKSSDWNEIKAGVSNKYSGQLNFISEDLFAQDQQGILDFARQADSIITKIKSFEGFEGKKILLGYSLGGRIALHILQQSPELFDHFVFLSTNPGLKNEAEDERKNRILHDQKWSEKISLENWDEFLKEWNSQGIFAGSGAEPKRDLQNYDLLKLKESMVKWSLGKQTDFSDTLQMFNYKVTWVVGERDAKYLAIAEALKSKNSIADYIKVPAGHRIWLDNPDAVVDVISQLL